VIGIMINHTQCGITDLRGVEHLENLYKLSREDIEVIKEYTPIQELNKLTILNLNDKRTKDI
jgi:hypothetical protein